MDNDDWIGYNSVHTQRISREAHMNILTKYSFPIKCIHKEHKLRSKITAFLCLDRMSSLPHDIIYYIINLDKRCLASNERCIVPRVLSGRYGSHIYISSKPASEFRWQINTIKLIPRDIYNYSRFAYTHNHIEQSLLRKYHYMPELCKFINRISLYQVDSRAPRPERDENPCAVVVPLNGI